MLYFFFAIVVYYYPAHQAQPSPNHVLRCCLPEAGAEPTRHTLSTTGNGPSGLVPRVKPPYASACTRTVGFGLAKGYALECRGVAKRAGSLGLLTLNLFQVARRALSPKSSPPGHLKCCGASSFSTSEKDVLGCRETVASKYEQENASLMARIPNHNC